MSISDPLSIIDYEYKQLRLVLLDISLDRVGREARTAPFLSYWPHDKFLYRFNIQETL